MAMLKLTSKHQKRPVWINPTYVVEVSQSSEPGAIITMMAPNDAGSHRIQVFEDAETVVAILDGHLKDVRA